VQQLVIVIYGSKRPVKRLEGPREVLENVSVAVTLQWQAPRIMTTSALLSIKKSYRGASVLSAASVENRRRVESTALHWLADPVVKQNLQRFADKSGCTRSQTAYTAYRIANGIVITVAMTKATPRHALRKTDSRNSFLQRRNQ
jgi:hypothetical protein